jgi:alginate O-acetyltransferase complex protein AlgJ
MVIENGVVCGHSNWLYLLAGNNSLMDYHVGAKQLSESEVRGWKNTLQLRHAWHQQREIQYLHVVAPNKICVYPEFYPEALTIVGDRPILQLIEACGDLFIYQQDYLLNLKKEFVLYHETDTHWNDIGSFFAYQQIMELVGSPYSQQTLNFQELRRFEKEIVGDLGRRFSPPKSHVAKLAKVDQPQAQKTFDNEAINRGLIKKFENQSGVVGKILIFGDSFSHSLIPFFAESFQSAIYCHAEFVDFDYVEIEKPDIVLSHKIERFMIQLPDDIRSPRVTDYARVLGKVESDQTSVLAANPSQSSTAIVQIEDTIRLSPPNADKLYRFQLGSPQKGATVLFQRLEIYGWVLGKNCPAKRIEILQDGRLLIETPVDRLRLDVAKIHSQFSFAETSGFFVTLEVPKTNLGSYELLVQVVLEDESIVAMANICYSFVNAKI